jgi:hypothetical protein
MLSKSYRKRHLHEHQMRTAIQLLVRRYASDIAADIYLPNDFDKYSFCPPKG